MPGNETFFVHPLDGEVFANLVNMSTGFQVSTIYELVLPNFKVLVNSGNPNHHFGSILIFRFQIFIHGPYETTDASSKSIVSDNGYFLQVYLTALTIFTSGRAKAMSVGQRKCRFYDESNLKHSPVYSYKLCRMECRINAAIKLCGCIPFFYRKLRKF